MEAPSARRLYVSFCSTDLTRLQEMFIIEGALTESMLVRATYKRHLALIAAALREKEARQLARDQRHLERKARAAARKKEKDR